jgi:glycosyltransferase involved in cell wall biosynthesis
MARGLPPVVSDIPGNREWVTSDKNVWLVPARSTSSFAGAILQAADLPLVVRDRIAERNRQIVRERADWRKNFDRLLKAYESIEGETA